MGRWPRRALPGLLIVGSAGLLVVPSANFAWFAGLPLRTPAALGALAVLAPYGISAGLRSAYTGLLAKGGKLLAGLASAALLAALLVKVVLLMSGAHSGFLACYRSLDPAGPPGCQRSFDNPFFRFHVTRLDGKLDFGPRGLPTDFTNPFGLFDGIQRTNWDLGFLNTSPFNYAVGGKPDVLRRRWPRFAARWEASIDRPAGGGPVRVVYVGEGAVTVGGTVLHLPPAYGATRSVELTPAPGLQRISVDYRFDPVAIPSQFATPPMATLQLVSAGETPVPAVAPALGWRLLALLCDLVAAAVALSLLMVLLSQMRRVRLVVALFVAGGAASVLVVTGAAPSATRVVFLILVVALPVVVLRRTRDVAPLGFGVACYLALVGLETARAIASYGTLNMVLYAGAGQDFLTYESFARSILETGSLRGGESVFVYSPGIRYLLYLQHLLLGDGNVTIGIMGVVALTLCVLLVARRLQVRPGMRNVAGLDAALMLVAAGLVLVTQAVGVDMVRAGFSEYPAWVFLLLGLYCLLGVRSFRSAAFGVSLAALAFTFRFDQAVGLALLCVLIAVAWARETSAELRGILLGLTGLGIVFVLIGGLPAVHNLYYGHQVAVLLRTPNLPVNFPIPYNKALTALADPKLRPVLVSQLRGVADVAPAVPSTQIVGARLAFDVAIHGLQVAWLAAVAAAVARRRHVSTVGKLLLALPLALLLPHLIIQVYVYYPRHIVAGYLAMGLAASYVFAELCGVGQARPVSEAN